jgi:glutamate/aspartate transport system substrate-binding protein
VQTLRKNKRAANMDFKEVFGKDHADSFLLLETGARTRS